MKQHTVLITTDKGTFDYLVVDEEVTDEVVQDLYDRYVNDEAGKELKGEKLVSWEQIN